MPLVSQTVLHLADESKENLLMDSGGSARLEKLRELYLAWRRDTFGGDPTAPLQYLWEEHQEDGARLFTDMHEAWGNSHKTKQGIFWLDVKKTFFTVRITKQ